MKQTNCHTHLHPSTFDAKHRRGRFENESMRTSTTHDYPKTAPWTIRTQPEGSTAHQPEVGPYDMMRRDQTRDVQGGLDAPVAIATSYRRVRALTHDAQTSGAVSRPPTMQDARATANTDRLMTMHGERIGTALRRQNVGKQCSTRTIATQLTKSTLEEELSTCQSLAAARLAQTPGVAHLS